jgi:hypothetical protein
MARILTRSGFRAESARSCSAFSRRRPPNWQPSADFRTEFLHQLLYGFFWKAEHGGQLVNYAPNRRLMIIAEDNDAERIR